MKPPLVKRFSRQRLDESVPITVEAVSRLVKETHMGECCGEQAEKNSRCIHFGFVYYGVFGEV